MKSGDFVSCDGVKQFLCCRRRSINLSFHILVSSACFQFSLKNKETNKKTYPHLPQSCNLEELIYWKVSSMDMEHVARWLPWGGAQTQSEAEQTSYPQTLQRPEGSLTGGAELGMTGRCGAERLGLLPLLFRGLLSPSLSLHLSHRSLRRGGSTLSLFFPFLLIFLCCGKTEKKKILFRWRERLSEIKSRLWAWKATTQWERKKEIQGIKGQRAYQ